jgi:hypothetical protein
LAKRFASGKFGDEKPDGENPNGEKFGGEGFGGVAQLGEHLLCKQRVMGSSPFTSTGF